VTPSPSQHPFAIHGDALAIGDFVCTILHFVYVKSRPDFERMAREQGAPLESIAAAVVAQGLIDRFGPGPLAD
jgi:hypothetical protein